jgi:hypothetical protein
MPPDINATVSTLHVAASHVCDAGFVAYDLWCGQQEETGQDTREVLWGFLHW